MRVKQLPRTLVCVEKIRWHKAKDRLNDGGLASSNSSRDAEYWHNSIAIAAPARRRYFGMSGNAGSVASGVGMVCTTSSCSSSE